MMGALKVSIPILDRRRLTDGGQQYYGVGSIPWSPLARGLLARPVNKSSDSLRDTSDPGVLRFTKAYLGGGGAETIKR